MDSKRRPIWQALRDQPKVDHGPVDRFDGGASISEYQLGQGFQAMLKANPNFFGSAEEAERYHQDHATDPDKISFARTHKGTGKTKTMIWFNGMQWVHDKTDNSMYRRAGDRLIKQVDIR